MSYSSTWTYLLKLTEVCTASPKWALDMELEPSSGCTTGEKVYTGSEISQFQTYKHSSMLNVIAQLAVKISNFPDWTIDWRTTLHNVPQ